MGVGVGVGVGEGWRLIDIRLYVHIIFSDQILFSTFHIFFFVDPYE